MMRIAVASDGLNVSTQNGRCESYTCYTVDRGIITQCQNTPNPCLSPNHTADFLHDLGVDVLVVNVLDPAFAKAFKQANIEVAAGLSGPTQKAAETYLANMLYDNDSLCNDELSPDTTFGKNSA